MPVPIRLATAVIACMTLMLVSGAENSPGPSAPGPPAPGQPPPPAQPPPSGPTVVRMAIVGPTEIAPGESVQLIAHAVKSDGSVEDVSSQVVWSLYSTPSLQLSPTGLATGVERGDAQVVARLGQGHTLPHANKWFFVVPKGTFVLSGTIREQGVVIPNVTVQVLSGTGQGLSSSAPGGGFRLYGVAGPVQLELRKNDSSRRFRRSTSWDT